MHLFVVLAILFLTERNNIVQKMSGTIIMVNGTYDLEE